MAKISLHIQRVQHWHKEMLYALGAGWVKIVNPGPGDDPFPGLKKCLRFWTDNWDGAMMARRESGAEQYMANMLPLWQQFRNWGECAFELPNEPACNGNDDIANLTAFTRRCVEIAHREGFKVVALNLPEGNPSDNGTGDPSVVAWKMRQLADGIQEADYLGLHAYWCPPDTPPEDPWHSLRYRDLMRFIRQDNKRVPPILLTEAGIDGGIIGRKWTGWRTLSNQEQYTNDVIAFEAEVQKDAEVQAYFLFTSGFEDPWASFDHDEGVMRSLVGRLPEPKPEPKPEPEPAPVYNQSSRHGHKVNWIVVHGTEGKADVADAMFRDPATAKSAHYIIRKNGGLIRCVPEIMAAWHCGSASVRLPGVEHGAIGGVSIENLVSVGIELEQWPGETTLTPEAVVTLTALCTEICQRHNIPADHIVTHAMIDPTRKSDPKGLDLTALRGAVQGGDMSKVETTIRQLAWAQGGIPYHPDWAFPRFARERGLGMPMGPETDATIDGVTYRWQRFSGGIVYAKVGDWSNCKLIAF